MNKGSLRRRRSLRKKQQMRNNSCNNKVGRTKQKRKLPKRSPPSSDRNEEETDSTESSDRSCSSSETEDYCEQKPFAARKLPNLPPNLRRTTRFTTPSTVGTPTNPSTPTFEGRLRPRHRQAPSIVTRQSSRVPNRAQPRRVSSWRQTTPLGSADYSKFFETGEDLEELREKMRKKAIPTRHEKKAMPAAPSSMSLASSTYCPPSCSSSSSKTKDDDMLSEMDQLMMDRCAFAGIEVAIENAEVDHTMEKLRPASVKEELVEIASPEAPSPEKRKTSQNEAPPCRNDREDDACTSSCGFSLHSCRPQFRKIATHLGLELREQSDSLAFVCPRGPNNSEGSLLCFSESVNGNSICVQQCQLNDTSEWSKMGREQFMDAVLGRCVRFFGSQPRRGEDERRENRKE